MDSGSATPPRFPRSATPLDSTGGSKLNKTFTPKQGQYLAFIYYYTKIHGVSPAEADMQRYFRVSAPSVHQMIVTLEDNGLIKRTPGHPRSIRLLLSRDEIPDLE